MSQEPIQKSKPAPAAMKPARKGPGGSRPGVGRPPGRKNVATVKRERRLRRQITKELATLTPEQIEAMDAYAVLDWIMKTHARAGDLAGAAAAAKELIVYQRPKMASTDAATPLPADMEPDPPPAPDEAAPENPVL